MDPDDIVDDETLVDDEQLDEDLDDELIEDEDPGDDQDDEPDADPEPPRKNRAQARIETLDTERKTEKERADRLERELQQFRQGPQKSQEQIQAERTAHLATLTEGGRLEYLINETRQQTAQQIQQIQLASSDASDKAAFQGLCARSPALAGLESEVEKRLVELRASGTNAFRETIAKYLLGEKALAKVGRAKAAGRKRETEGRDRQGARPVNGRGDIAPNSNRRTNDREARRKRLEGQSI